MRITTVLGTVTLLGTALSPVAAAAAPASAAPAGHAATCSDERSGTSFTANRTGGSGNDNIWVVNGDVVSAQGGDDRIFTEQITDGPFASDVVICGDGENDWIGYSGGNQPSGSISARGGTGADTILGGTNNDALNGNAGTDNLFGNDGNDILKGEDGNDNIWGGDGDDVIDGGAATDVVDGGPGYDRCINAEFAVNCEATS